MLSEHQNVFYAESNGDLMGGNGINQKFVSTLFACSSYIREQGQILRGGKGGISKFSLQTSIYRILNRVAKQPAWRIRNMTDKTDTIVPKQAIQLTGIIL